MHVLQVREPRLERLNSQPPGRGGKPGLPLLELFSSPYQVTSPRKPGSFSLSMWSSSTTKYSNLLKEASPLLVRYLPLLSLLCVAVDCMDPTCSGRGVCVRGECHCSVGWGGTNCETPRATCLDQCSGHGTFLPDTGLCSCDPNWTGHDCSVGKCGENKGTA